MALIQLVLVLVLAVSQIAVCILAGSIDEQHVVGSPVLLEDHDACRNRSAVEKVSRQADDCVQEVLLDHGLTDASLGGTAEQNTVGNDCRHAAIATQRMQHVEQECPVTFACRGNSPVEAMETVEVCSHLELLILVAGTVILTAGIKAFCPLVE